MRPLSRDEAADLAAALLPVEPYNLKDEVPGHFDDIKEPRRLWRIAIPQPLPLVLGHVYQLHESAEADAACCRAALADALVAASSRATCSADAPCKIEHRNP